MFALIIPGNIKGMTEGTSNARSFQLHQYLPYKPYSSFTPTWMSVDFMYTSNDILDISKSIPMLTEVKPEVNRACSLELASHCQRQQSKLRRKYSWTYNLTISKWGRPYVGPQCYVQLFLCNLTTKKSWNLRITDPLCMCGRSSPHRTSNV